jgi:hypothetical protein
MKNQLTANIEIKFESTPRGFVRMDFVDSNLEPCSLQESSLATEPHIWLGCNNNAPIHQPTGNQMSPRMHLSQADVQTLLPHLQRFADMGYLLVEKV